MAIDPSISLAVQPPKFESPVNMLSQAYALQNAAQQNRLGQMQMAEYERARAEEEGIRNYLRSADLAKPGAEQGLLQYGKTGLAYAKQLQENRAAALKQKTDQLKYSSDLAEQAGRIYNTVTDEKSWQAARQKLAALGGDPSTLPANYDPNFVQSELAQAVSVKDQWERVKPKPMKVERADGSIVFLDENPNSPTFKQEIMPAQATGMTPYQKGSLAVQQGQLGVAQGRLGVEQQRLAQEATGVVYQEDAQGNIVALPSKLKKGEVPTARVAVAPGGGLQPLTAKPSEAVGKEQMSLNQQKSIVKGALDAVETTPTAFGWTEGMTPEAIRGRMASSDENQARAYVFNVVSGVIKERAGTAQSAAEAETLRRFLPVETDNAQIIKDKMIGFQKYLDAKESGTTKKKTSTAPTRELAPMDKAALEWANANPSDPRATQIKQRLGM